MAKASSFVSEVMAAADASKPTTLNWFAKLPADAQAELEEIRRRFDPSTQITRHVARAIIAAAERRGWAMPKERQVAEWLGARSQTK
jgi:cob(I)alamin adenosyltransferase